MVDIIKIMIIYSVLIFEGDLKSDLACFHVDVAYKHVNSAITFRFL